MRLHRNVVKRVLLVTTGDVLASMACGKLFQDRKQTGFEIVAVVNSAISFKKSFRILRKGMNQGTAFYVLYMLLEVYGLKIANCIHYFFKRLGLRNKHARGVFNHAKKAGIPIIKLSNINRRDAIRAIQLYNPDLVLCIRPGQILKNKLIASCPRILNLHCTFLPKYRGIGGIFQALSNKEKELGCTVHVIDSEKVDAGPIIVQKKIPTDDSSSLLKWTIKLYEEAQDLILQAINQKSGVDRIQSGESSYFSWPQKTDLQRYLSTGRKIFTISDFH